MLARQRLRLRNQFKRLIGATSQRVVFLHIPKCAGTSLNHHFKSNFGSGQSGNSVLLDSSLGSAFEPGQLRKAQSAQFVAGHHGWRTLRRVAEGAVTFTVIRDPYERLRSMYEFVHSDAKLKHPHFLAMRQVAVDSSFEDFCLSDDPNTRAFVDNAMTRTLSDDYFPYVRQTSANVEQAIENLEKLDFVVTQSRLDKAMPEIARRTRTELIHSGKRRNETSRTNAPVISKDEFLGDPRLHERIKGDLRLFERARAISL